MAEANIAEKQVNEAPPLTLENVMTVVKGVRNWRATAKILIYAYDREDVVHIVPATNLDDLQRRHGSDEDCLREVVKIFLQEGGLYGPPSWRQVIGSLYKSDEFQLARLFRRYCEPVTDSTLTVDNVVRVMDKVTSDEGRRREVWEEVLEWDGRTPSSYLDEVYSSDKEKTPVLADVYVNSRPSTSWINSRPDSWQDLAATLYRQGELAAAKEAKSFFQYNDPTFVVESVTAVLEKVSVKNGIRVLSRLLKSSNVYPELSSHTSDKDLLRIPACSEAYVHSHPWSSWEHLTSILYEEDELSAVDEARPFLPLRGELLWLTFVYSFLPLRDLTITTDRLMELFKSVKFVDMPFGLGEWLGLPQSARSEILVSFQDATKRKEAYLETYTHQHPCPSWRKVAEILNRRGLRQQAADTENTYVQVSETTQHNFDIAMKDGVLSIRNGSVFYIGPNGSGKSHTLAAILDEEPPSMRESTPCMKKPVRTIAQCKVGVLGARFVRLKDGEYSDMLSTTAKQVPQVAPSTDDTPSLPIQSKPQQKQASEEATASPASVARSKDNEESSAANPEKRKRHKSGFEMELLRRMQVVPKAPMDLRDKDLADNRDSGGQPAFHEVLPIFVKNTTIGILTVKLNESLHSYPMVEYYTKGQPIGEPFKSHFTHLQTFRHCMRVLQSTCDSKSCPKLVFVGTHKDLEHECEPKESREEKNKELRKIIPPAMKDSVIRCGESMEELIHAVNVKTPGDEDREVIGRLREIMIEQLKKLPKQKIPLRYFALENAFLREAKYRGKAVLSKEECFEIAAGFQFTRESFEAALEYLHGLKLIFYYKEILPDVIFIDAQALLDKITELVKYILSLRSKTPLKITATCGIEEFKSYGIVTLELLSQFKSHYIPGLFTERELILIFKYLRILAKVGDDKYLVPCLLNTSDLPAPSVAQGDAHTIPDLLFYFGPDGPKLGIYCCLVASLITDSKWELMTEDNRPVQLSRNQVQFKLPGDDAGAITITDPFSSCFHVNVTFPDNIDATEMHEIYKKLCPSIRETILGGIRKASHSLNYTNSIPKIAFACSKHLATDVHPATLSSTGGLTCTTHPASVRNKLTDEHKLWFGEGTPSQGGQAPAASTTTVSTIDSCPTLAKLSMLRTAQGEKIQIIKRLAPNWRSVGILLDFDKDGTELDIIEKDHSDSVARCQAMFQHWLKGNGLEPCSWRTLVGVLEDCDQEILAKDIQRAFS